MFNPFAQNQQETAAPDTTTKAGRLTEVVSSLIESLPVPPQYQIMVKPLTGQLVTSCQQLQESDIDEMIAKFKGFVDYVEHGDN